MNESNYELNIYLISSNKEDGVEFKNSFKRKNENIIAKTIFDFWNFIDNLDKSFEQQVDIIFKEFLDLKKNGKKECIQNECLVVISNESEAELILQKMNSEIKNKDFMPLTLFLYKEKEFEINIEEKYPRIDPRTIVIEKFSNLNYIQNSQEYNPIFMILMRFCSIYNELGEEFKIGDKNDKITYSLTTNAFPFYLNILCIGKFRQGKSTTVNCILNELKARETGAGTSQTRKISRYEVENNPIRIYDLPGFQDKDSIDDVVNKMKELNKGINDLKDKIHLILYVFNKNSPDIFQDKEFLIFKELINHKEAKIIYIFTHSSKNNDDEKEEIIEKIDRAKNTIIEKGIERLKEEKEKNNLNEIQILKTNIEEKMKITKENLVLVNFHKKDFPKIGINDLFETINRLFQSTASYKKRNEDRIKKGEDLKKRAKEELKNYLIGGSIIGAIPIVDIFCQETYFKPNAIKKVEQIFGLDYSKIVKEESEWFQKIGHNAAVGGGEGVGAGFIKVGLDKVSKTITTTVVENVEKSYWLLFKTTEAVEKTVQTTQQVSNSLLKTGAGFATLGISAIFGVALGYYFTSKNMDFIIEKLYEYYIKDKTETGKSYEQAADYLCKMEKKYQPYFKESV